MRRDYKKRMSRYSVWCGGSVSGSWLWLGFGCPGKMLGEGGRGRGREMAGGREGCGEADVIGKEMWLTHHHHGSA